MHSDKALKIMCFMFPEIGFIIYYSKRKSDSEMSSDIFNVCVWGLIFQMIVYFIFF